MRARIILVFVLLAAVSLSAQTFRGTILGTATDATGAVVAGAKVTVKNVATGLERTTETSADGSYALPELPIGTYTVTVTLTGFQTFVDQRSDGGCGHGAPSRCGHEAGPGLDQEWKLEENSCPKWRRLPPSLAVRLTAQNESRPCLSTAATTEADLSSIPASPDLPTRSRTLPALTGIFR